MGLPRIFFFVCVLVLSIADAQKATLSAASFLGGNGQDMITSLGLMGNTVVMAGQTKSTDFPKIASPMVEDTFISSYDGTVLSSILFGGNGIDTINKIIVNEDEGTTIVVGGTTSTNLPVTSNAAQSTIGGGKDAFVVVIDENFNLTYVSYLGGSGDDEAFGVALESDGNMVVVGYSNSNDFPLNTPVSAPFGFLTVLSMTARLDSFGFLGLASVSGVSINSRNYICIIGSPSSTFETRTSPTTTNSVGGIGLDGAIILLDSTYDVVYSTKYGGGSTDVFTSVTTDNTRFYITGWTMSSNFPVASAAQSNIKGLSDAVLIAYSDVGVRAFATYLGGSEDDKAYDVAVNNGTVYIVGQTNSANFPTTSSALQSNMSSASSDAFVAALSYQGLFSFGTFLGGSYDDRATAVVASDDSVTVAGWTLSSDFPTVSPFQASKSGSYDGFMATMNVVLTPRNQTTPIPSPSGTPSFTTGQQQGSRSSRGGVIAGIVLGLFFGILIIVGILAGLVWLFGRND